MMSRTPANIVICFLGHAYGAPATNIKMERRRWQEKPLIVGRSGTQNSLGNKTAELVLWSTFNAILLQRIKHF